MDVSLTLVYKDKQLLGHIYCLAYTHKVGLAWHADIVDQMTIILAFGAHLNGRES